MKINRFMIAAPKSGSGKTMITCALLRLIKNRGEKLSSYKCGPDYIDPMFHSKVLDVPSKNLDTFFTDEETTVQLFLDGKSDGDFAVLEGVMGLYDGLGGIRQEGSSYHLAEVTHTPIVLVVDANGMGKSIIALISGFLQYDQKHLIKGVLLNRMSKGYYDIIKPLIEQELPIKVIGYFSEQKDIIIESRHLRLKMPDEINNIKKRLDNIAFRIDKTINLDLLMDIANSAGDICCKTVEKKQNENIQSTVNIAVAKDEAFCFYYEDNIILLEKYGAKLQYFSPVHDTALPDNCDALLLGGGYPELYEKELSENKSMLSSVKVAFKNGMPTIAECGGFMYLHKCIHNSCDKPFDAKNSEFPLVGELDAECSFKGKLVRFGYIELKEKYSNFLPQNEKIKAHEFHYFDSTNNGNDCIAVKPTTGKTYDCIISKGNYWLGFPHLYFPSNPHFVENFIKKAQKYKEEKLL